MTRNQISAIAIAFSALLTGQVVAAEQAPLTRAQVKAELAEAIRTGNIIAGESSQKLNELYPQNYPVQAAASSKTRAQVQAELAEAVRTGNVIAGNTGRKLNEIYPQNYPAQVSSASKTREEVRLELVEAIRNGTHREVGA